MGYVKLNNGNLSSAITKAKTIQKYLDDLVEHVNSFKSDAETESRSWPTNSTIIEKWVKYVKANFKTSDYGYEDSGYYDNNSNGIQDPDESSYSNWIWYDEKVKNEAISLIKDKKAEYDAKAVSIFSEDNMQNDIQSVLDSLTSIQTAIETFEGETPSLEEALKTLGTLPEGFSVENMTINLDGEEVTIETLVYTDEDGTHTISEMVNAFYTYVGITVASNIVIAYDNPNMSAEELDAKLTENGRKTKETVNTYLSRGYMSVASTGGISQMYEDATGQEYNRREVHNKYFGAFDVDALNSAFEGLTNASAIGAMALSGLVNGAYGDLPEKVDKGAFSIPSTEQEKDKKDKDKDKKKRSKIINQEDFEDDSDNEIDVGSDSDTGGERSYAPSGSSGNNATEKIKARKSKKDIEAGMEVDKEADVEADMGLDLKEVLKEEIKKELGDVTDNGVVDIVKEKINPAPKIDSLTNKDVDSLAQDKFYEQYTPEELADYRSNQINEFNSLAKDELVDYLEKSGYTTQDANAIASNKELGLAAFLAAKQSSDLANISKSIAQNSNMDMTMFDTRFDDNPSYNSLLNGETNAFLSNPNLDQNVVNAKNEMNNAKVNYDNALDRANTSINEANDNKAKLDSVKQNIVKKSGTNTDKWSDKDVEKYNKAVNKYNESVTKANEDVSSAQKAKETYENSKEKYENAKDEYYEKIKDDIVANRDISASDDIPSEIPENKIPESNNNSEVPEHGDGIDNNLSDVESGSDNSEYVDVSKDGSGLGFRDTSENVETEIANDSSNVENIANGSNNAEQIINNIEDNKLIEDIPNDNMLSDTTIMNGNGENVVSKNTGLGFSNDYDVGEGIAETNYLNNGESSFNYENTEYVINEEIPTMQSSIDSQTINQQTVDPTIIQQIYNNESNIDINTSSNRNN